MTAEVTKSPCSTIVDPAFFAEEERSGYVVTQEKKELWSIQLECYQELKRVCEKHNITYYATGGTLLGAVRHKGFIPWDDDMDFFMLEEEYERFLKIAPQEIKEPFFFQSFETQPTMGISLSRIRKSTTTAVTDRELETVDSNYNLGIFIDILPFSGVADSLFGRLKQKFTLYYYKGMIGGYRHEEKCRKSGRFGLKEKLNPMYLYWCIFRNFYSFERVARGATRAMFKYQTSKTVGVVLMFGFKKYLFERAYLEGERVWLPFENTTVPAMARYDDYLTNFYGDYSKFVMNSEEHTMAFYDARVPYAEHPRLLEHFEQTH